MLYCFNLTSPPLHVSELSEDAVAQYLHENPKFLEDYVLSHVNQERLNRWTAWKEQVRRQRHGDAVNGTFDVCFSNKDDDKNKLHVKGKRLSLCKVCNKQMQDDVMNGSSKSPVLYWYSQW